MPRILMVPKRFTFIFSLLTGIVLFTPVDASDLDDVKRLLEAHDYKAAYTALTAIEVQHAGEVEYDFMLGRAALETGHPHEAIFAFERVLLNQPENDRARLELALSYYLTGEDETARQLFQQVLDRDPPTVVTNKINKFLHAIERRIRARQFLFSAYVELRQGYSSNINSATTNSEVEIFGISFQLNDASRAIADSFTQLDTGVHYIYKQNRNVAYFTGLSFAGLENNTENYDTETTSLQLGPMFNTRIGRLRIPLLAQVVRLDSVTYQRVSSLSTDLLHNHKGFSSNYFVQHSQIRYPDSSPQDVDSTTFGFGISTSYTSVRNYQLMLFHGTETALKTLYDYNAKTFTGIETGMRWRLNRRHSLFPRIRYQAVVYNKRHPFFSNIREDDYTLLAMKWVWQLDRSWTFTSKLQAIDNNSNLPLYQYQQNQAVIGIRYGF